MELDLKECMGVIRKRLWLIMLIVLVVSLATAALSLFVIKPVYSAETKLLVTTTNQNTLGNNVLDIGTINAQIKLVGTYKEVITTAAIMDRVVESHPGFMLDARQLASKIKVSSTIDSQVLVLTVFDYSHDRAVLIVNAVAEVFKSEIAKIMKVENITIVNPAKHTQNPSPASPNTYLNIMMAFVISCLLSVGLSFLLELLDDSVKSEEDISEQFGVPILATISRISKKDLNHQKTSIISKKVGETIYANANQ